VFEPVEETGDAPQTVRFGPATGLTPEALAALAEQVRVRVLRWFARSGLIEPDDVREMLAWENSGFSLDAAVRVGAHDRAGVPGTVYLIVPSSGVGCSIFHRKAARRSCSFDVWSQGATEQREAEPEVSPQIRPDLLLGEQRIMVTRGPLIQRPDGVDQFGHGRSAILQRQQQPGQKQLRVGAALAASRSHTPVHPAALRGGAISHSRIAAKEAISTSTV
jgi:hypothetical protein